MHKTSTLGKREREKKRRTLSPTKGDIDGQREREQVAVKLKQCQEQLSGERRRRRKEKVLLKSFFPLLDMRKVLTLRRTGRKETKSGEWCTKETNAREATYSHVQYPIISRENRTRKRTREREREHNYRLFLSSSTNIN